MPEGDTIHRLAATLAPRLVGKTLERVTTQGLPRAIAGQLVTAVTAHGKHLVIELADGTHVRVHLGMYGRWRFHDRATGEAALAKLSPGRARLALVTADGVYLFVGAKTVEIAPRRAPRRGQAIAALGPDVLADDFDGRRAASRAAAAHPARTIADVLLDQRIASGIGNIYKSESLFVRGIDPRTPTGRLTEADLTALYAAARELMTERRTDRLVYGRTNQPCPRCATPIACYQLGDPARWTWSCPRCQSLATPTGANR